MILDNDGRRTRRILRAAMLALALAGLSSAPAAAQVGPDLRPGDAPARPYPHLLPIWGKQAAEKGFKLPLPYGLNFIFAHMQQPIDIESIKLRVNDSEFLDVSDLIVFEEVRSKVSTGVFRLDVWLFPFLNVYGLVGGGTSNTSVELSQPISLSASPVQSVSTYGLGVTGAFGLSKFFLAADYNLTWSDLESLSKPVFGQILSLRLGRNFRFADGSELGIWVGAMHQRFEADTSGSMRLSDVFTPDGGAVGDFVDDLQAECDDGKLQSCAQLRLVEQALDALQAVGDAEIGYDLDKAPAAPWNMIAGAQWGINEHWYVRVEAGFLRRYSFLFNVNYRFGLGLGGSQP